MQYRVVKTFRNIDGATLVGGVDTIECSDDRAARLRFNGLIGGAVESAVTAPAEVAIGRSAESAVESDRESRNRKRNR